MSKAIYAGSFDPMTKGHMDVIERSLLIFDTVIVGIGVNVDKPGLFSIEERINLIKKAFGSKKDIIIESYSGLTADFARKMKCSHLVRGLRDGHDFSFEMRAAMMNKHLEPSLETVFIPTSAEYSNVSSSLIKEVAALGGDVSDFLPGHVAKALKEKLSKNSIKKKKN